MPNLTTAYVFVLDSDNVIEVYQLTDSRTSTSVSGATVTCTVETQVGVPVSGSSWPITLTEVSPGTYRGILPRTLVLDVRTSYVVIVQAVALSGLQRTFRTRLVVTTG